MGNHVYRGVEGGCGQSVELERGQRKVGVGAMAMKQLINTTRLYTSYKFPNEERHEKLAVLETLKKNLKN